MKKRNKEDEVKEIKFLKQLMLIPPFLYPKHVGYISKGMAEAEQRFPAVVQRQLTTGGLQSGC
jgi:hypothetical protein